MSVLKLQGEESVINATPSTVADSSFVRLVNKGTAALLITHSQVAANSGNVTCSILSGEELFLAKKPSDTLSSTDQANLVATSVKFYSL